MYEREIPQFDLRKIADSGQSFRLRETAPGEFEVVARDRVLRMLDRGASRYAFSCGEDEFRAIWVPYFDLETDYGAFCRLAPPSDRFLSRALRFGDGLRILRQDPWEMLITFLISQRKNIPAIRSSVERLCRRFGEPIGGGENVRYAFPTPVALAGRSGEELAACSLGYRTEYVRSAARMVAQGELDLCRAASLSDRELLDLLMTVPGVGPKVANCILLFGFHRIAAFPRDVWINRVIDREYGGDFPLERYDGCAGVIQQYLFYYARSGSRGDAAVVGESC